ncbi:heterokaryon incompatibility protein-domain-containing protein [Hypomontagnella monticulosa]|nr:heterokaryon incompatibility protein-domain-containing protein [Hypomontagnella monticulosa]
MKLINCSTKKLEEFFEPNIPPYAILSHTWGDDEVTYEDFIHRISDRTTQKGWPKIEKTCLLASESNLQYCWVDTCCIDKASSAVLTEEINSMFKWYSSARVCYVYLVDFDHLELKTLSTCRWFERGWTLQELIAASNVEFYDKNWVYFGTKLKLHQDISDITGIDDDVLTWEDSVQHRLRLKPICKKMSWAAKRKTTRTEDIAYSLLGIFGVNMPLIYGEGGRKAFQRLQEEIIKYSNDYTIFAWEGRGNWNFLAPGPSSFARGGRIQLTHHHFYEPEFQLTNQGLRLNARLRTPDCMPVLPRRPG